MCFLFWKRTWNIQHEPQHISSTYAFSPATWMAYVHNTVYMWQSSLLSFFFEAGILIELSHDWYAVDAIDTFRHGLTIRDSGQKIAWIRNYCIFTRHSYTGTITGHYMDYWLPVHQQGCMIYCNYSWLAFEHCGLYCFTLNLSYRHWMLRHYFRIPPNHHCSCALAPPWTGSLVMDRWLKVAEG